MVWALAGGVWKKGCATEQTGRLIHVAFDTGEPKKVYHFSKTKLRDVDDKHFPCRMAQAGKKARCNYPDRVTTTTKRECEEQLRGPLQARIVEFITFCIKKLLELLSFMLRGQLNTGWTFGQVGLAYIAQLYKCALST